MQEGAAYVSGSVLPRLVGEFHSSRFAFLEGPGIGGRAFSLPVRMDPFYWQEIYGRKQVLVF